MIPGVKIKINNETHKKSPPKNIGRGSRNRRIELRQLSTYGPHGLEGEFLI
jgi:hypothetical protein